MLKKILLSFLVLVAILFSTRETLIAGECSCSAWIQSGQCGYWGASEVAPFPVEFNYPDSSCGGGCYGNATISSCAYFY